MGARREIREATGCALCDLIRKELAEEEDGSARICTCGIVHERKTLKSVKSTGQLTRALLETWESGYFSKDQRARHLAWRREQLLKGKVLWIKGKPLRASEELLSAFAAAQKTGASSTQS